MSNIINVFQVSAAGKNPVVTGDKRLTLLNTIRLLRGILEGQRPRSSTCSVVAEHTGVQAAAVVTCAAVANADTVTINGQALTAAQFNATATATFSTIVAGNSVTINGVTLTARAAAASELEFNLGASDTEAATNLAAAINACSDGRIRNVVTATSAAAVVTVRAYTAGTAGNSITFTKTGSPITVTGSGVLANGAAAVNNQFDYKGSNTEVAASLCACIAASTTDLVSRHVSGANVAGAVTITALRAGHDGNAITIATSNGTRLAITGSVSRLAGGSSTRTSFTF